jgi:hypothetical protein
LLAGKRDLVPFDFTKSRLTPRPARRFGRGTVWATVISAALVLGIGWLYYSVITKETEQTRLESELRDKAQQIKDAQANVDRVNLGRSFFETRAPFLECLREITLTFKDVTSNLRDNEFLFLTSFKTTDARRISTLRTDPKVARPAAPGLVTRGDLTGKASSNTSVTALLERLKKNPNFSAVQLLSMADSGGRSREVLFRVSFTHTVPE